jgi:hypothetical protein
MRERMESANSNALPIDADGFHFLYSYAVFSLSSSGIVGLLSFLKGTPIRNSEHIKNFLSFPFFVFTEPPS